MAAPLSSDEVVLRFGKTAQNGKKTLLQTLRQAVSRQPQAQTVSMDRAQVQTAYIMEKLKQDNSLVSGRADEVRLNYLVKRVLEASVRNATPELLAALAHDNKWNVLAPGGLLGLDGDVALRMGLTINRQVDERLNLDQNLKHAAKYLLYLHHRFLMVQEDALMAYRVGEDLVKRQILKPSSLNEDERQALAEARQFARRIGLYAHAFKPKATQPEIERMAKRMETLPEFKELTQNKAFMEELERVYDVLNSDSKVDMPLLASVNFFASQLNGKVGDSASLQEIEENLARMKTLLRKFGNRELYALMAFQVGENLVKEYVLSPQPLTRQKRQKIQQAKDFAMAVINTSAQLRLQVPDLAEPLNAGSNPKRSTDKRAYDLVMLAALTAIIATMTVNQLIKPADIPVVSNPSAIVQVIDPPSPNTVMLPIVEASPAVTFTFPDTGAQTESAQAAPLPAGEMIEYQVARGDTLGEIATRFNSTVDAIMLANEGLILDADEIETGWHIMIPVAPATLPEWTAPETTQPTVIQQAQPEATVMPDTTLIQPSAETGAVNPFQLNNPDPAQTGEGNIIIVEDGTQDTTVETQAPGIIIVDNGSPEGAGEAEQAADAITVEEAPAGTILVAPEGTVSQDEEQAGIQVQAEGLQETPETAQISPEATQSPPEVIIQASPDTPTPEATQVVIADPLPAASRDLLNRNGLAGNTNAEIAATMLGRWSSYYSTDNPFPDELKAGLIPVVFQNPQHVTDMAARYGIPESAIYELNDVTPENITGQSGYLPVLGIFVQQPELEPPPVIQNTAPEAQGAQIAPLPGGVSNIASLDTLVAPLPFQDYPYNPSLPITESDFNLLKDMARRQNVDPLWMLSIFLHETAYSPGADGQYFNPNKANSGGCVGSIQWCAQGERWKGDLSFAEQLPHIEERMNHWFDNYRSPQTAIDYYLMVFTPAYINETGNIGDLSAGGTKAAVYRNNSGADLDNDGDISALELQRIIARRYDDMRAMYPENLADLSANTEVAVEVPADPAQTNTETAVVVSADPNLANPAAEGNVTIEVQGANLEAQTDPTSVIPAVDLQAADTSQLTQVVDNSAALTAAPLSVIPGYESLPRFQAFPLSDYASTGTGFAAGVSYQGGGGHTAIDFFENRNNDAPAEFIAPLPGTVVHTGALYLDNENHDIGRGNAAVVDIGDMPDGRNVYVVYSHANFPDGVYVSPGQTVEAGQAIGRMGKDGYGINSAGEHTKIHHLHFEVVVGHYTGDWQNPFTADSVFVDPAAFMAEAPDAPEGFMDWVKSQYGTRKPHKITPATMPTQ